MKQHTLIVNIIYDINNTVGNLPRTSVNCERINRKSKLQNIKSVFIVQ